MSEVEAQQKHATDEEVLAHLGIEQELKREWGVLQNFGASFSIISVITGITTLFETGLLVGGPAVMSIGWLVVACVTLVSVGLSMAEIVSAVPSSGGPYYWAAVLSPPKYQPFNAWVTGWFNLLGQVGVTTGISFGLAGLISTVCTLKNDYEPTPGKTIGIYAAILVSHGLINTFGVKTLKYFNNTSIILHSLGVASICIAVLAKAPTHQSASFVFGKFFDGTGTDAPGWSIRASKEYVAVTGILMSQYTITGFDASAHMSEETKNASWAAAVGVVTSIGVSAVFGFFVILAFLFSIQDFDSTVASPTGQPVLQIFLDVFGVNGAIVLMTFIMVCVWHCGLFSIASNSRMMYSFARDGGLPKPLSHVHGKYQVPVRTIWLAVLLSFCLALPSLGSSVAFAAATSIATIGLYISYSLPVLIKLIFPRYFVKGPFNLGKLSKFINIICCSWVGFITVAFCLPTANPVTSQTLNYSAVAVGIVGGWALLSWIYFRKHFKGPIRPEDIERIDGTYSLEVNAGPDEKGVTTASGKF
ncbi:Uga4p [Sugiyamaella lignohabitans]|uniref:Uga4p n=1 Tax=Sugiyamaella lignohabitans TaxID=796027 RepID=A0A167F8J6_9ASCO|nr:Uga4p [Sugiyamaella lignohabitans]ANB14958.1 Uga4p [Sugiyamaella lignohabitans]